MYNKVECICLTCDNCGETYMDDHSGFSIYVDENGAHEAAEDDGWHLEGDKHYCPECHTIDDEDNLIYAFDARGFEYRLLEPDKLNTY